jgi:hypothetical protein
MPAKRSKTGRRKTGKITVSMRFSPRTRAMLDAAAEQFELDSVSAYVEEAVLERLERDKIIGPSLKRKKS